MTRAVRFTSRFYLINLTACFASFSIILRAFSFSSVDKTPSDKTKYIPPIKRMKKISSGKWKIMIAQMLMYDALGNLFSPRGVSGRAAEGKSLISELIAIFNFPENFNPGFLFWGNSGQGFSGIFSLRPAIIHCDSSCKSSQRWWGFVTNAVKAGQTRNRKRA